MQRRRCLRDRCRLAYAYIGGAAVYPTAGAVNPTLTLVALSLRLADHLKTNVKGN